MIVEIKAMEMEIKNIREPVLYLVSKYLPIKEASIIGTAIYADTFVNISTPSLHHGFSMFLLFIKRKWLSFATPA